MNSSRYWRLNETDLWLTQLMKQNDIGEALTTHHTLVHAEFDADVLRAAVARGLLHHSDSCPWTQRHDFLSFFIHLVKKNSETAFNMHCSHFVFALKENQGRKDKKGHREDREESALRERWVYTNVNIAILWEKVPISSFCLLFTHCHLRKRTWKKNLELIMRCYITGRPSREVFTFGWRIREQWYVNPTDVQKCLLEALMRSTERSQTFS